MSPENCTENPTLCKESGGTGKFGYPAHFDLQNADNQICETDGFSQDCIGPGRGSLEHVILDNPEVTYEEVSCAQDFNETIWKNDCKDSYHYRGTLVFGKVCGKQYSPDIYNYSNCWRSDPDSPLTCH